MSPGHRQHTIIWVSLLLLTLPASVIFSQPLRRLSHITYNVNEGLLQSHVSDITEDGNGFIWISSGGGVQRFDGRNFFHIPVTTNSNGIPDDRYVHFFNLQNGNLWLSHQKGVSEYDITTNKFRFIRQIIPETGFPHGPFAEEGAGIWYWFAQKGLYKLDKKTLLFTDSIKTENQNFFNSSATGIPVFTGRYFIQNTDAELMITDRQSGREILIRNPGVKHYYFAVVKFTPEIALVATARGIEKLICSTGELILLQPYKTQPDIVNLLHPVQLRKVSETTILVSEANKLFELDLVKGSYISQLTNLQNGDFTEVGYITGLFHDSHSNLWILSENDGIRKVNYRFAGFRYFGTDTRKNNYVKAIYADKEDNRVLCGTFGEGLLVFDTAQHLLKRIQAFPGMQGPITICGFIRTSPQHYLVIAMGNWNIYLLNTIDFTWKKINTSVTHIMNQVTHDRLPDYHLSIFTINDSVSIIQTGFHINKLVWQAQGKVSLYELDMLKFASVSSFLTPNNRLLVGSYGRYYLSGPGFNQFREFLLPENKLVRCFTGNDEGQIWMGTEKGLYLLDSSGKVLKVIGKSEGLPDDNIYAIRLDKRNNLWLSHNKGISCRKPDGSFLHFSKNDGLQENEFNTNTSFETHDGELFFGGVNGISSFYPATVTDVKENPQVILTGIKVKDADWNPDTAYWSIRKIILPYYSNSISFDLAAIGNRATDQYNYQYQLAGQDTGWVNAGNNSQVRFSLQPGRYVFRYYAGNSFEINPEKVKELSIIIKAPFWKTAWFIAAMIVLFAGSTVLITRYISQVKLKRKIKDLEHKRALDEERTRISREMHDDIGAGLTQITLMSENAKNNALNTEPLNEIADASRKLVGSMSEIIWSINPENATLEQLLSYLREQLHKLLEYSGINYEIRFPENGKDILLTNSQRRNLLLVTKEIVHNAVKHSRASNISVVCMIDKNQLLFTIIDDGKGFNTSGRSQGNGLRNIKRRVEELNGTLEIDSSNQQGSRFKYSISLS